MTLGIDTSRPGIWLSGAAHLALLVGAVVTFATTRLPDAEEGIPVEMLTDNQVSEITRGETTAAQVQPDAKPRAERVADKQVLNTPREAPDNVPAPPKRPPDVKVADEEVVPAPTPPVRAELDKPEPPPPTPPARAERQEAVEAAKAEAKAAAAKAEAIKQADAKEAQERAAAEKAEADKAQAEAKAKAEQDRKVKEADAKAKAEADAKAKREVERKRVADAKAAEAKAAKAKAEADAKARRQAEQADRFDPGDISRLLSSRDPARSTGATGRELQRTASLGSDSGTAPRLNPSQRDQIAGLIREQLIRCWQPPVAVQTSLRPPVATVRVGLKQDGSLATEPAVVNSSSDPLFRPVADSALRATRRCAPLRIPARFTPFYQDWKDLMVEFDPREIG